MHFIGYLIFGLVAGAIARLLHPGKDPMNWVWTMLLGLAGAALGGFVGDQFGVGREGLLGWATAIGGAIVLLALYHVFTARNAAISNGAGPATNDDYKQAVFNDLSKGPRD